MKNIIKNKWLGVNYTLTPFFMIFGGKAMTILRSSCRRGLAWGVAACAVALVVVGCADATPTKFNPDKAAALSPEKRKEFDLIFFNEVATWDVSSNRNSSSLLSKLAIGPPLVAA